MPSAPKVCAVLQTYTQKRVATDLHFHASALAAPVLQVDHPDQSNAHPATADRVLRMRYVPLTLHQKRCGLLGYPPVAYALDGDDPYKAHFQEQYPIHPPQMTVRSDRPWSHSNVQDAGRCGQESPRFGYRL
ncbi:hypothetical protein D1872_196110 [compost metagenome]